MGINDFDVEVLTRGGGGNEVFGLYGRIVVSFLRILVVGSDDGTNDSASCIFVPTASSTVSTDNKLIIVVYDVYT